jgi:hypothetical protein
MSETEPADFEHGSADIVALKAAAWAAEMMAWCPTAAPSPAMSAMSSLPGTAWDGTPYSGYADGSWTGWPGSSLTVSDEFALPEAEAITAAGSEPSSHNDEVTQGAVSEDFNLQNMKELLETSILASLQKASKTADDTQGDAQQEVVVEADKASESSTQSLEKRAQKTKDVSAKIPLPPGLEDMRDESKWPSGTTTVMLRNIPNKYTQKMLADVINKEGYKGEVDFMYLPIDFKNKCNVGYVFVNFRTDNACLRFASEFHQAASKEKLPGFNSQKICEVVPAKFQGQMENVRRLQTNPVMAQLVETPEWLPQIFDEDGLELPFPTPASGNSNTKNAKVSRTTRKPAPPVTKTGSSTKEVHGRQWD